MRLSIYMNTRTDISSGNKSALKYSFSLFLSQYRTHFIPILKNEKSMNKISIILLLTFFFIVFSSTLSQRVTASSSSNSQLLKKKDIPLSSASMNHEISSGLGDELPDQDQISIPSFIFTALRGFIIALPLMIIAV